MHFQYIDAFSIIRSLFESSAFSSFGDVSTHADQIMTLRYPNGYQAPHAAVVRVQIRRETLLEDGIRQLNNIGGDMKRKVQVRHCRCL